MDNKRYFSFNLTKTKIINFFKNGTEIEKILYKIYANNLSKVIAISKKHLKEEIINSSHDIRKFW